MTNPLAEEIKALYLALRCKFGVEEARSWKFLVIIRQLHDFSLTECSKKKNVARGPASRAHMFMLRCPLDILLDHNT
jgi:hypothetical protein